MLHEVIKILGGSLELLQLNSQQTTIAILCDVIRCNHQHHVDDRESFVESLRIQINLLQVQKHSRKDLTRRYARQQTVRKLEAVAVSAGKPFAAVFNRHDGSAVERIEKELFHWIHVLHDEV